MVRRRRYGRGVLSSLGRALGSANRFLKSTKAISRIGNALGAAGVPYASQVAGVAGSLGYGRRRKYKSRHRVRRRRY
jgi:hypothetical protein